jgi:hypothetical protein
VTPTSINPSPPPTSFFNYNFAVARVRLSGTPNTNSNANVLVLFRLFASQTSDTDYQPLTYPSTSDSEGQPLAARPGAAPGTGQLENYPDELMIDWGDTPVGSTASIYWRALAATELLSLAKQFYSTHQLSAADAHTIQCTVPNGYTCVPIRSGTGANFAGLFTVNLPQGLTSGETFTITVRRISTQPATATPPPPPPQTQAPEATTTTDGEPMRNWRYVVGTFAVRIPVTTETVMLPIEENIFSIIKWRLSQMAPSNRWIPVLQRYLGLIEGRIRGLGGNPATIAPSPWGAYGPPQEIGKHPRLHEATGKVNGIVYNRFGDFEGFSLLTEDGHERVFRSRESEMEALVRFAWQDRVVIAVLSEGDAAHCPVSIILRRAPPQPRRRGP